MTLVNIQLLYVIDLRQSTAMIKHTGIKDIDIDYIIYNKL